MRRPTFLAAIAVVSALSAAAVAPAPAAAVVGGREADPGEWPWQVALLVDGGIWCGGSLLAADIVLTAAHCTEGRDPADFEVVAGTIDLAEEGQRRRGAAIDQHESYDEVELRNDIALLTLDAPFELNDLVALVELATPEVSGARTEEGDAAVVTGFGAVAEDEGPSNRLLEADLETLGDDRCQVLYREDGDTIYGESQVCAGVDRGHVDACYGDSGGPLVVPVDEEQSSWRQVGIVSWGAGCGQPRRPTVYTEVAAFGDWLALRGVGPDAGQQFTGEGSRLPARGTRGKAAAYPMRIEITGVAEPVEAVSVRLVGLRHERPEDLDVWLVAPDGTTVTLLSDVGGREVLEETTLLVVDGATQAGSGPLSAQFEPSDREPDRQRKGATPPADLSLLEGVDANGEWQLLVADDEGRSAGHLDGWSLQLT